VGDLLVGASGLSKTFGKGPSAATAVREATFEVHAGDLISLVGPSGSGKSTLLHLIAGLDQPSTGTIEWPGLGPPATLRPGPLAVSFQGPSLLPPLSVEENVALPLLLEGAGEHEALDEARDILERLELTPVAARLPEDLSGGQSQRAALARALVGRPKLVLADEPTGQQDRETGQRAIDVLLDRVRALGAALIVATHDLSVADRLPIRWSLQDRRLDSGVALRSS
jgi:ABC-type lipoprotein export system ATPase subunit